MPAAHAHPVSSAGTPRVWRELIAHAPEACLAVQVVSLWPVVVWTARRARDGSDEPWGLVALAALLVVAALSRKVATRQTSTPAVIVTLAYALCLPWLTPLPCAVVGLLALALSLSQYLYGRTLSFGLLGLCWLSLPLLASLEFYLGYPLRWLTAEAATWLLHCSGIAVQRSGVSLIVNGAEIAVDPACSGIRMLWGTALLIAILGCLRPLPFASSIKRSSVVLGLLIAANAWRVAALFYLESGRVRAPRWFHDAVGAAVFVITLATAMVIWHRAALHHSASLGVARSRRRVAPQGGSAWPLCSAASVALAASALGALPATAKELSISGVAWPREFERKALKPVLPTPEVARFYRNFPGSVGFFRTDTQHLILRTVSAPTRMLHPAEHCYRANGYTVEPARQCVRANGARYGCFMATRGEQHLRVSERIHDERGQEFTDVSGWYWAAVFGRTKGPWHSVTIAETAQRTDFSAGIEP